MKEDLVGFLLTDFRRAPGMYLGSYSLSKLSIFVTGFMVACGKYEVIKTADNRFTQFQEWFNQKYAIEFTSFWHTPFLDLTHGNDEAALDLFFQELELFAHENTS